MFRKKKVQIVRYNPDINIGLTKNELKERRENKLVNVSKQKNSKTYTRIVLENLLTFFNLIWALIFVALLIVGAYADLLFAVVIVANTLIAIIQEVKAKYTVEKLKLITQPKIKVLREGKFEAISAKEMVLDDILEIESGNQIPADLIILKGSIEVNESLLTGESVPIKKKEGDCLLAGSFITSGKCLARADRIGNNIYIQTIAKQAKQLSQPKSNLAKDLKKLIKYIGFFIIPLGTLMFVNNYYFYGADLVTSITKTCGSLTGMIPAGMFLLVTIGLAVGVIKLSKKHTLVQELYSIEMLARTNILCLDKTGTITDGTMRVKDLIVLKKEYKENISDIISNIISCQPTENQTSRALISHFGKRDNIDYIYNIPFSSEKKQTVTLFENIGSFALGAPEYIKATLTKTQKTKIKNISQKGYRVIMIAHSNEEIKTDEIKEAFTPIALIVIEDRIRDDAESTIAWFKNNGVEIKIISGDNTDTVCSIAQRVGVENADKCISLENLSLEEVAKLADKYTVFGRVTPEQKHALIKALKNSGNVVAMTGDGVNDTLALKESDCSIAMADGSEVARNISSLVLMDSKFSSLPKVVEEGRQVINNVQESSSLFLMKTFFTLILSVISILTFSLYPFTPIQLSMIESLVIGVPSLFLTLQKNTSRIKGEFLPVVLKRSLPYACILFLNIAIVLLFYKINVISFGEMNSLSTLTLTVIGFLCMLKLSYPFTKLKLIYLSISAFFILNFCLFIPDFFRITEITNVVLYSLGFFASVTALALLIWWKIQENFKKKKQMIISKQ